MLSAIGNPIPLDGYVLRLKLLCFGHVKIPNELERAVMNGMVEGSRGQDRPKTTWKDEIKEALEMTTATLEEAAHDRLSWRRQITRAAENRTRLWQHTTRQDTFCE